MVLSVQSSMLVCDDLVRWTRRDLEFVSSLGINSFSFAFAIAKLFSFRAALLYLCYHVMDCLPAR